jgi:SsrA-binding protein
MRPMKSNQTKVILADNRKARFDYEIIEVLEAGIELFGEEVKSIRNGSVNLKWTYVLLTSWRPSLVGMHVSEFKWWMRKIDPKRERTLLLNKRQIDSLQWKIKATSATIVPLEVYTKWNLIKVSIALVKWRKRWEKKQVLKERDLERELTQYYR